MSSMHTTKRLPLEDVFELALSPCRERRVLKWPVLNDVLAGRVPVILYPAARMAGEAALKLRRLGVQVLGFGDSNPALWNRIVDGSAVWSPDEIASFHPNVPVLVASTLHDSAITESLTQKGCSTVIPVGFLNLVLPEVFVSREYSGSLNAVSNPACHATIKRIHESLADEESREVLVAKLLFYLTGEKPLLDGIRSDRSIYFDEDLVSISPDEVVVDGGAYTDDTLRTFMNCCEGKFRSYYAFEPDPDNFSKLQNSPMVDGIRVIAVQAGLARRSGGLRFTSTSCVDARFLSELEPGGETIRVVGLDDFFSDRPVPNFIKMDIEGGESEALQGSEKLIVQHEPTLAISAYHHPSDLWELPALIQALNPRYRLFLRHYTREIDDTVCYAIPAGR